MKHSSLLTIAVTLFILILSNLSFAESVTTENITGTWDDNGITKIHPNREVSFDFRYIHEPNGSIQTFTNYFQVWTTGGSSFTPVTGDTILPGFSNRFDLGLFINSYSADGIGADTIGIEGTNVFSSAFPSIGFNDVIFRIYTGGIQDGETLCIDSVTFPFTAQGQLFFNDWKWLHSEDGDIAPDWSGQVCLEAAYEPCDGATQITCVNTLINNNCNTMVHTFSATSSNGQTSVRYALVDGPGIIDSLTGAWSYAIDQITVPTIDTIKIAVYDNCVTDSSFCTTVISILKEVPGDFNQDCASDISDLVFLVDFIFLNGPPPEPFLSGDLSGDSEVDITDLVMMVEFIFGGGEPPEITNAPTSLIGSHCDEMFFDFDVSGSEPNWSVNIGTIDANGVWSYTPSLADVGAPLELIVTANYYHETTVDVNLTFTNEAPVIENIAEVPSNIMSYIDTYFQFTAADDCDPITYSVIAGPATVDSITGLLTINMPTGQHEIYVECSDGNASSFYDLSVVSVGGI